MTAVSIITATIPGRERMLAELELSVASQSFDGFFEHIVEFDAELEGCSAMVNRAVAKATGDWLFLIADDDVMLPRCLEHHVAASASADIVYSPPLVSGNEDRFWFFQAPPVLPATALIRKDLWFRLGGYDPDARYEEDRGLWVKAVEANARFVKVDEPTWVYRMHSANKSFNKVAA